MSDTPRTDAEAFFNPKGWTHNDRSVEVAPARFARTLERELADLRKIAEQAQEIERLKGCWAMACADGEKAQRELASKDATIAGLRSDYRTLCAGVRDRDATIAEQAQEIEGLKREVERLVACHGPQLLARDKLLEQAERERDEALELCQREVANANKTTTAALLMGAQTNEALKEARKALVWFWQHLDRVLLNAGYLRPQIPDEHGHALRQARDAVDAERAAARNLGGDRDR